MPLAVYPGKLMVYFHHMYHARKSSAAGLILRFNGRAPGLEHIRLY